MAAEDVEEVAGPPAVAAAEEEDVARGNRRPGTRGTTPRAAAEEGEREARGTHWSSPETAAAADKSRDGWLKNTWRSRFNFSCSGRAN